MARWPTQARLLGRDTKRLVRWFRNPLVPILSVLVTWGVVWYVSIDPGRPLWRLQEIGYDAVRGIPRDQYARYRGDVGVIGEDTAMAIVLAAALLAAILTAAWTQRRSPESRWRLALVVTGATAAAGYGVAEVVENDLLRTVVEGLGGDLPRHQVRHLGQATMVKWVLLATAVLTMLVLIQRRPPSRVVPTRWGARPDLDPTGANWKPDPARFGVSVTGGGIRAASFALGVLQELRARDLLQHARYVTSVSGGSYMAGAFTAINQPPEDPTEAFPDPPASNEPGGDAEAQRQLGLGSPELHRMRRTLRYIATDAGVLAGALARVVFGVLLNLTLLYLLLFVFLRPVGWAIGTPLLHDELRITTPVASSVEGVSDDPDIGDGSDAEPPWLESCPSLNSPDPDETAVADLDDRSPDKTAVAGHGFGTVFPLSEERVAIEWTTTVPDQCVKVTAASDDDPVAFVVAVTETRRAVIALEDGRLSIERQPRFELTTRADRATDCRTQTRPGQCGFMADFDPAHLFSVEQPVLAVEDGDGVSSLAIAGDFLTVESPLDLRPLSPIELRGDLDVDGRHWKPAVWLLAIAVGFLALRVVGRPDSWRAVNRLFTITGAAGGAWLTVAVVLPWLVAVVPNRLLDVAETGPSADLWNFVGLNSLTNGSWIPNLVAWPILSIAAVWRWAGKRKEPASKPTSSSTTRALFAKIGRLVRSLLVSTVLVLVVVLTATMIMAAGAVNGPWGRLTNFGGRSLDSDFLVWFAVAIGLVVFRGVGEASSWSPGPIYKRRLSYAFAWERTGGDARRRSYSIDGRTASWAKLVPDIDAQRVPATEDRIGYLDGHCGDGTELVLCCAANVLGEDRAPTGRRSTSFTISRSFVGGPEVGWLDTPTYVSRLGRRRSWDLTLPGAVAISGAAAAPAMGKKEIGPIGSVLAMLNVRLGVWLPHPQWVGAATGVGSWQHNPGWPWFVREVLRKFKNEAPYLYVSDGGHWENLGLVESLRRGCGTIVAISAGGDGKLSHSTIAEAVEIARSDLGVQISLDQVWTLRPVVGGDDPQPGPGERQYVLEPGPNATVGRMSPSGFAFGTFTYPNGTVGDLLIIDATMVDGLPVDVHGYAEVQPEFPHVSTGDQLFTNRDFESYRVLGRTIAGQAFDTGYGEAFAEKIGNSVRT